ncbi:hypothetical protein KCP75_10475 [Salmonella enterica subsp. enterica]|nr:hypothetical protein KCP75_10475 [Salmonella enterica subsp. enterica]
MVQRHLLFGYVAIYRPLAAYRNADNGEVDGLIWRKNVLALGPPLSKNQFADARADGSRPPFIAGGERAGSSPSALTRYTSSNFSQSEGGFAWRQPRP